MSEYTPFYDFSAKDALATGDANKLVKGVEVDFETAAIQTAIVTKADLASPTFTGTTTLATVALSTSAISGAATFSGDIEFDGQVILAKGADVASAAGLSLGTDGNYFDITGTTDITSIDTLGIGTVVRLHFDGILTLTHHATDLVMPGGIDMVTAAGDEAVFVEYASADWRCLGYSQVAGIPVTDDHDHAYAGASTAWATGTVHVVGDKRQSTTPDGKLYAECTTAGTSDGSTEPTWPTSHGATVVDNTVTWTMMDGQGDPITPNSLEGPIAGLYIDGLNWTDGNTSANTGYVKKFEFMIGRTGTHTIRIGAASQSAGTNPRLRIYKNGAAFGTERTAITAVNEALAFAAGDLCQLYVRDTTEGSSTFVDIYMMSITDNPIGSNAQGYSLGDFT